MLITLVHLRTHDTLAPLAAGFGFSEETAYAYITADIDFLATRAPGLLKRFCAKVIRTTCCSTGP